MLTSHAWSAIYTVLSHMKFKSRISPHVQSKVWLE